MLKSLINPDLSEKKTNLVLGLMLIMLLALSTNLMAANHEVSNLNDSGDGSLREAIAGVHSGGTITFSVTGTITLASQLSIDKDMTITGPGADQLSIDGDASSRIFRIDSDDDDDVVTITGLTITNGSADYGGGIHNYSDNLTLENCTISGNSAVNEGGGMYNYGYDGGTCSPTLTNCTISGNSASSNGGGMCNDGEGGTCSPTLTNCILWNDNAGSSGNEVYNSSATPSYSCCDVEGGVSGTGNINSDPLFVTAVPTAPSSGGDLHLQNGSPCLSTGLDPDGSNGVPYTDLEGRSRPLGSGTDMGCYEQYDDGTLPVTLSSFTAQYLNDFPTLCWTTQSETDNAGWNIYRGEDEEALSNEETYQLNLSLDLIPGAGTTSEPTDYSFEDVFPIIEGSTYFYWLESVDYSGETEIYGPISLTIPENEWQNPNSPEIPKPYGLHQNYPNPFNPNTEISFMLKENCIGELSIYNLKGQKIRILFKDKSIPKDELIISNWNGKDETDKEVSSGVYYYKLMTSKGDFVRKMILLK